MAAAALRTRSTRSCSWSASPAASPWASPCSSWARRAPGRRPPSSSSPPLSAIRSSCTTSTSRATRQVLSSFEHSPILSHMSHPHSPPNVSGDSVLFWLLSLTQHSTLQPICHTSHFPHVYINRRSFLCRAHRRVPMSSLSLYSSSEYMTQTLPVDFFVFCRAHRRVPAGAAEAHLRATRRKI